MFASLAALSGCGGSEPPPVDRFKLKVAEDGKGYNLSLAAYLPPLDGGRIELAAPADWTTAPRPVDELARFYQGSITGLPRIDVVAEESRHDGFDDLTEENVVALAKKK